MYMPRQSLEKKIYIYPFLSFVLVYVSIAFFLTKFNANISGSNLTSCDGLVFHASQIGCISCGLQ